jgi:hypothetical protein
MLYNRFHMFSNSSNPGNIHESVCSVHAGLPNNTSSRLPSLQGYQSPPAPCYWWQRTRTVCEIRLWECEDPERLFVHVARGASTYQGTSLAFVDFLQLIPRRLNTCIRFLRLFWNLEHLQSTWHDWVWMDIQEMRLIFFKPELFGNISPSLGRITKHSWKTLNKV